MFLDKSLELQDDLRSIFKKMKLNKGQVLADYVEKHRITGHGTVLENCAKVVCGDDE